MRKDEKKTGIVRRPFLFASCLLLTQVAVASPIWHTGEMPSHMQQQLAADQQERKLTGVVYGSDGETLPGAHVYVKGNIQCAVVTDLDGKFTLKVPANAKALVASFVGFETAEIPITKKTNYVITLNSGSEIEEVEVVATGYQLFKKKLIYR